MPFSDKKSNYYINIAKLIQETAQQAFLCYYHSQKNESNEHKETCKKVIEKAIAMIARKSAGVEANTACPLWVYQSKEPKQVKALRKF